MEARRPDPRPNNAARRRAWQRAWRRVRRTGALRGEPKLAWESLARRARRQGKSLPARLETSAVDVGADQGTSATAGRRALDALSAAGLLRVLDRSGGRLLVELHDPTDVLRRADAEPQRPLWDSRASSDYGAAETATEAGAQPATEARPQPSPQDLDLNARAPKTKDLDYGAQPGAGSSQESKSKVADGSGDGSERGSVAPLGAVLADVLGRVDDVAGQERRVQALVAEIYAAIGDRSLDNETALIVAEATLDGRLKRRHFSSLLLSLRKARAEGKLRKTPADYFAGSARRKFAELHLPWE